MYYVFYVLPSKVYVFCIMCLKYVFFGYVYMIIYV